MNYLGYKGRGVIKIIGSRVLIGIIILIGISYLSACKKWLDKAPTDTLALPTTLKDLQALLDDKDDLNQSITPSSIEASSDDFFLQQAEYNSLANNYDRVSPYIWDNVLLSGENDWKECYYPVYVANLCLEQLKKIPKTNSNSKEWDNINGSSHFLRAYYFLELCWTYSNTYDLSTAETDLGIAVRLTSNLGELSVRATVKQSYEQLLRDAKEAAIYLPEISIHCLRPSKCAAYGLLARAYLSMRQYDSALVYADRSLQIYNQLIDYNSDPDIINSYSSAGPPFSKYNKEIVYYSEMNTINPAAQPYYAKTDSFLYASYESNDLRKIAFFRPSGSFMTFKGSSSATSFYFTGIATDELQLIKAECLARIGGLNRSGDKDKALAALNELLLKRWKKGTFNPIIAGNLSKALEIILIERRKELLMRGLRWADLKRLNKEGAEITLKRIINGKIYSLLPNDNRYAQPIPVEIIILTGMQQNPR